MGVTITFWAFGKKTNSTKQPGLTDVVKQTFSGCDIKEETSISSPIVIINYNFGIHPGTLYNYAKIDEFNRYYFIIDWVYSNGLWYAYLAVDVLASFKSAILSHTAYVLRSASRYDGSVVDSYYPILANHSYLTNEVSGIWSTDFNSGTYIVGIINSDSYAVGAVSYYAFTASQFKSFRSYLMLNTNDWIDSASIATAAAELSEALIKTLNNPFQYIASINWFPFTLAASSGSAITSLPFGWWTLSCSCTRISKLYADFSVILNVPKHPQKDRGDYLLTEPYSAYELTFPPFGTFPIPSGTLRTKSTITCAVRVDLVSGKACLAVGSGAVFIVNMTAQLAVPVSIATISTSIDSWQGLALNVVAGVVQNRTSPLTTLVSGVVPSARNEILNAAAYHLPEVGSEVSTALSGIADGIQAGSQQLSVTGSNGSVADLYISPRLMLDAAMIAAENLSEYGRPFCQSVLLSTLSGFCMCYNPDVMLPTALQGEKDAITNFLKAGFFIE